MTAVDIIQSEGATNRLAINVRNLSVALAGSSDVVVDDVSFTLRPGEILGLVGESGSGKTTVGLAMLGYSRRGLDIIAGSVVIGGEDILTLSDEQRRLARRSLISYVPQDPATALNPTLRLRTQLSESFADPAEATEDRLLQMLAEVKLPATSAFLHRFTHQLSGGQQQRIAIAMAFAHRPHVIVMDEPTTGLDVTTQSHILETIRHLCRQHHVAAVYVSHDLAVVGGLADRVAVMYAGRILELGAAERVLRRPDHPYTQALIRAVPDLKGRTTIQGIPGQAPDPHHRPTGCAFAARCNMAADSCRQQAVPSLHTADNHVVQCLFPGEHRDRLAPVSNDWQAVPMASAVTALSVADLTAFHGSRQILQGITLEVPRQTCLALVGESGSGKTTLARSIAGLHHDLTGQLSFNGQDLPIGSRNRSRDLRRRIQYVFQNPYASLNPRRSIGRSLEVALLEFEKLPGVALRERVIAALESVALPARFASLYPHQLSGGQRQRAAIARALVLEPEFLICDEVTSALDVSVQAVVVDLLRRLQHERGLAMLFVTHNLALVRNIAQQVAVLQSGRIVEQGDALDVLERPQAEETLRLLRDAPHFELGETTERDLPVNRGIVAVAKGLQSTALAG